MNLFRRSMLTAVTLVFASVAILPGRPAQAGIGPENVAVVVNADSWASLAVANEYIRLRNIPACNVVYLSGLPQISGAQSFMTTDLPTFREKILKTTLDTLSQRGLGGQIDCITYSTDLPYAVWYTDKKDYGEQASVTGLTYLCQMLQTPANAFLGRNTNGYFRRAEKSGDNQYRLQPPMGFSSRQGWDLSGQRADGDKGMHYMLSTMLAYTSGKGNSVTEAINYLRRSAAADGTRPDGTIYIVKNSNLRSTIRQWAFDDTIAKLKAMGIKAELIDGIGHNPELTCPPNKADVAGAVLGMSDYDWKVCGSTILPGAIVENLTSYGGSFRDGGGQTPISEFLRFGAAGSSGTVTEPMGVQWKFPTPFIQVFYTGGFTLAEAFYMSIQSPYQILVMGDPLCKPWAKSPKVSVKDLQAGQPLSGQVSVQPLVEMPADVKPDRVELYVDGKRIEDFKEKNAGNLDTTKYSDGYHGIRVVAVAANDFATQGDCVIPVTFNNRKQSVELSSTGKSAAMDGKFTIQAKMAGAKRIVIKQNDRELGAIDGAEGKLEIPAAKLGLGATKIQAVGMLQAPEAAAAGMVPMDKMCFSAPLELEVTPPKPIAALKDSPANLEYGLKLTNSAGESRVVLRARSYNWLTEGVKPGQSYVLEGFFKVPATDMYQFQIRSVAKAVIEVDGVVVGQGDGNVFKIVPVSLEAGTHKMVVKGDASDKVVLELWNGGPGTLPVGQAAVVNLKPPEFSHVPFETAFPPIYLPKDPQAGMKPLLNPTTAPAKDK